MTDPFTDVADELMSRPTDSTTTDSGITDPHITEMGSDFPAAPAPSAGTKTKKHVCPYCGAVTNVVDKPTGPCPRCSMDDTPATRAATKSRIGPWYVLQSRNPSAPGMKWATLLSLVSKGQVTPRSIVRGPTTHQLWKFAAHVKGLSREFNLCYSCGGEIEKTANQCVHCDRLQEPPVNPDTLLETRDMAMAAGPRAPVQREIRQTAAPQMGPMSIQNQPAQSAPSMNPPTDLVIAGPTSSNVPAQDEMRRQRNPDDGILSAKELAAAFQLDFNPQVEAPMPAAAPVANRPPRVFKTLVVLIFLAAIGAGAAIYVKPEYRAKATVWMNHAFASSKHYLTSTTIDKKPTPSDSTANKSTTPWESSKPADSSAGATPPGPATPADSNATNSQSTQAPPAITSAPNPTPSVANSTPDHSADSTPPANTTPAPQPAPPQPVAQNQPAPSQSATPTPPQPSDADQNKSKLVSAEQALKDEQDNLNKALDTPNPGSLSIDQQRTLENTLYDGGINAEAASDLVLAVRCYKKIEELDPSVRHTDVHLRLTSLVAQLPH